MVVGTVTLVVANSWLIYVVPVSFNGECIFGILFDAWVAMLFSKNRLYK
jgi:hypothetical protein